MKSIYHIIKIFKTKNFELYASINLIIHATEKFVIEKNILQHEIQQLQKIFVNEKK